MCGCLSHTGADPELHCGRTALRAMPTELLGMDKEERFKAMTASIAQKVGIPVSDRAADAACQSRLQTAIEQSGSIPEPGEGGVGSQLPFMGFMVFHRSMRKFGGVQTV